jgi:hypothetical protein
LNKCYYYPKSSQQKKNNIKTLKEIMVFKIVFTMSNTSIKYLIQAIIIIISFTIPLTLDSSSLLTTTTTTALAFHVDSAGNPTIRQGNVGTGNGTTAAEGGSGANTALATVALNHINETRKAIQVGNSTAALKNLDLVEQQLSLLIDGVNSSIIGGGGVPAVISIPAEDGQQLQEQQLQEQQLQEQQLQEQQLQEQQLQEQQQQQQHHHLVTLLPLQKIATIMRTTIMMVK